MISAFYLAKRRNRQKKELKTGSKNMTITLARALKEKSRMAGRLKRNFEVLTKENSRIAGSPRSFDLNALMAETLELHQKIIALKQVIARANAPIAEKLAEMDEIKSAISYLNKIDVTDGIQPQSYREELCYEVIFSQADILRYVDELQRRGEAIQDELDVFNATTKVEWDNPS